MPVRPQARLADKIVDSAMFWLHVTPSRRIFCTKDALKQVILATIEEAHEIGYLAGLKEQNAALTLPGSRDRPAWMDIRLDDPEDLARHHIRFRPVVLKSLVRAGYRRLGDLRWVPNRELTLLKYIGFKSARQVLALVRRFERNAETPAAGTERTT